MPPIAPSLRPDLQLHEQGEVVRVTSPATGREHLLRAAEWRVAREMNGRRSLPELERRARRLGIPATAASLESFVRELQARGLLDGGASPPRFAARAWPAEKQRRAQAGLLALKEERYAEAQELLGGALEQDPACEELRAFAEGARRAEIDATSEQDEQSALAEAVLAAGEGLALPMPLPLSRVAVPAAPPPSRRWRVVAGLGIAALFALALPVPNQLRGDAVLAARDRAAVRATTAGRLDRVVARDGAPVHQGELLAQLADPDLGARLEAASARRRQAELELQELQSGPSSRQLERARASAARASAQVRAKQVAADRLSRAMEDGRATAIELAEAREALGEVRWDEQSARTALRLVEAGATAEALAQRRAALEEAQAAEAGLARKLEAGAIRAPRDGTFQAPDLALRLGAWVKPGDPIADVQGSHAFRVEGRLSELDAEDLAPGLPLRVQLPCGQAVVLTGRVESMGERFEPRAGAPAAVRVYGTVDDASGCARDGLSARLEVTHGRAPLARILLRRVRHFLAAHGP